ncbi:hypothetical protein EZV62_004754 [Acer yangbiense]|uniref:RNA polymerase Rpb4/RPC9 core domain-containing protein n=1 Tax=Acer yangbiense TaxID=1000413 RepID=A0A5C7IL54_9ROSI|nr:hypothetical protein EZV62_004754 [Acer yangbiense]
MEKGGKNFSLPTKTPKSSLKSAPPLGGKDDNSAKSKRGRKVQFDTQGSLEGNINLSSKSNDKFASLFKGGKGGKAANVAKASVVELPLELRIEQELPNNAKCLMDCETAHILEGIQEHMIVLSSDPTIKIPASFDKGLQYAKTGSHYTNPESVRTVLDNLSKHGVTNGEICVIAKVCPETVEEVFALVPSLKVRLLSWDVGDVHGGGFLCTRDVGCCLLR